MTSKTETRNAIVLAMFGTTVENGLPGLLHIRDRVAERFQYASINIAFTSKIIRRIWRERALDNDYRATHSKVPEEVLNVRSMEGVIHLLGEGGIDSLVVQPVQIAPAVGDVNLKNYSDLTENEMRTYFNRIAVGRPAFGVIGSEFSYKNDICAVAKSLNQDAEMARNEKAALFYMGHGNTRAETYGVYQELVQEMRRQYPDILTVMSMVEGGSSVGEIIIELKRNQVDNVILKPFMVVAGDHVRKEMVGSEPGTLKMVLENEGFIVRPVVKGLGEINAFADIFADHAAVAAQEAGIDLR